MSSHDAGTATGELSSTQQEALQTYMNVTGQEPDAAIPLLQRSQWNVQIAISKFFDGEGPDLVQEARDALNAPQDIRRTQNLMYDLDELPPRAGPSTARSLSSRPSGLEPAPRIETQPENLPAYRPPFLLSLLFSPLNLLYRLLYSSFRLVGTLFPFLPRWLNVTTGSAPPQRSFNTSGRKALGPQDTAARFIREFEEEYGTHSLPFLENGYNMALEKAHRELKFLIVVLLSPEHDDTTSWVRETLLSRSVVEYITDPSNQILLWGGNVQDSEAYQVANSLRCTKFPFASVIVHTPNVSSTAMSNIGRIPGNTTASEFLTKIRTAISQNKEALDRVRARRTEQNASRTLRQEQDSAYERSLAQDRERARERREAEAARQRAAEEEAACLAAAAKLAADLQQWKKWRAQRIAPEPAADANAVRVSIRLPSGERVIRKFAADADLEELYAFVECYEVLLNPDDDDVTEDNNKSGEDEQNEKSQTDDISKPVGYEHKYGFRLVSPMPRTVYDVEAGGSVRDRIGRGGNLLVEPIDDEDDEDDDE